jgi:glycosyltransferase involved in cell wall biosynthesis
MTNGVEAAPGEVSVVIPTKDEEASILVLLEALAGQTLLPSEVIVADGGSADRTRQLAREFGGRAPFRVAVVEADEGLPGRNRNRGIGRAAHPWVACVDAGTVPRPDWLERLVAAAREHEGARVVYGDYEAATDTYFTECAAATYMPAGGQTRSIASCLLHRSAWEAAGGFREDLRSGEDLLFFKALDRARVDAAYCPEAVVRWSLQPDTARTFRRFAAYSRNGMKAGLAREWQFRVTRLYLVLLATVAAGLWWRPLLAVAPAVLLLRAARRVRRWFARGGRRAWAEVASPRRLLTVAWIQLVIDVAMFYGMWLWVRRDRGRAVRDA